ncbi:MAG: DNA alkylation repair protein [archaeon]
MTVHADLRKHASKEKAKLLSGFFKTGKGEYGEGDVFLGVMVPQSREVAKKHANLSLNEIKKLLHDKIHEVRLVGVLILVHKFAHADEKERKRFFDFYVHNSQKINNWDLVDLSAHRIIGAYLLDKDRALLYQLAQSESLWQRRISIISTFAFINKNDYTDALALAEKLMHDKHDLIHKAVGWVLREIGKKDEPTLRRFLDKHAMHMPRTMLRYSLEKLDQKTKERYMQS